MALVSGLMAAGCKVHDIGLAITPMAYFAQFALDVPCVAMVTASHNDNGWTGVKMGANRPLTFGPDRDEAAEGDRAGRASSISRAAALTSSSRISPTATSPISPSGRSSSASSRWSPPAATAPPAPSRREVLRGDRLRGGAARLRARPHLPALQSQHRRHEDAARHARRGAGAQGRRGARLRRRRRPLRRGRQRGRGDFRRQGRRHAGARHVERCTRARPSWST